MNEQVIYAVGKVQLIIKSLWFMNIIWAMGTGMPSGTAEYFLWIVQYQHITTRSRQLNATSDIHHCIDDPHVKELIDRTNSTVS